MPEPVHDDQWKNKAVGYAAAGTVAWRASRAAQQAILDDRYARGEITREEWVDGFDLLSQSNRDGSLRMITASK